jgi:hypothetical protein
VNLFERAENDLKSPFKRPLQVILFVFNSNRFDTAENRNSYSLKEEANETFLNIRQVVFLLILKYPQ